MLTTPGRRGYRAAFFSILAASLLLVGCATSQPVLHSFPEPLQPEARPPATVTYTLREHDQRTHGWVLRGEQGDVVGTFRWERAFRDAVGDAADRSEDFRRDDRFQDGINGADYTFRVSANSDRISGSSGWGVGPPRVTVFDARGERVGELELRTGFDRRYEGVWRGTAVLWRAEVLPAGSVKRDTDGGKVEDTYPAGQLLEWTGGSTAGLRVYTGRAVADGATQFGGPVHDIAAGRALTRRELGDAVSLLFAIRSLDEVVALANAGE